MDTTDAKEIDLVERKTVTVLPKEKKGSTTQMIY